jgi:hypothetical protein
MAAMRMLLHTGSDPSVDRRFARSTVVPSPEDTGPSPRFCWGYGLCGTAGGTCGKMGSLSYGSADLRQLDFKNSGWPSVSTCIPQTASGLKKPGVKPVAAARSDARGLVC